MSDTPVEVLVTAPERGLRAWCSAHEVLQRSVWPEMVGPKLLEGIRLAEAFRDVRLALMDCAAPRDRAALELLAAELMRGSAR